MGMFKEHAQAIADKKAIERYGEEFPELPMATQAELVEQGIEQAQTELTLIRDKD